MAWNKFSNVAIVTMATHYRWLHIKMFYIYISDICIEEIMRSIM